MGTSGDGRAARVGIGAAAFVVGVVVASWVRPGAPVVPPCPTAGPADAPDCAALRRDLDAAHASLRARLPDRPVPGPLEAAPPPEPPDEAHTEAGIRAALEEAIAACDLPLEVGELVCDEPPCVAVLRNPHDRDGTEWATLLGCPAWADRYPRGSRLFASTVACDDGTDDRLVFVSAVGSESGPVAAERWDERVEQLGGDWTCR